MTEAFDFEKNMKDLKQLVSSLENGDLPIDQALKNFQQGVKISTDLKKYLDDSQKTIDENLSQLNLDSERKGDQNEV
ncbi:exodeoxyribonuclease VII small subunit [Oenococcus kitaharae]|uniref:Exodeoxyribonuclease 7 small subunit n=1 Tax=Oenococcus kitaharae DSM 17330 TaxID=1045004 RepID=G9WJU8_9LACO|nr:exodeoxyribonuclease VII small subunit [Oenococcus kitaharae]EHN59297.1 Exodeoxyribonuclease VII small subunit [Oenococcus kitaharae DSM 17330]MCV3296053.1 exodeoxyribonuclease VII small subunit [Oenococcus kitaharae]OEY82182.1 exodeoxyribonuclease VII small subunit [Oenococcus kitaharae]OEY82605.1 exodeoxyribonuclease VII small subunit [Oenococcus kitaharae]OEY84861.1 exodeoxyribonuclease VII small subunit [Oenococcus kitaharae]